MINTFIINQFLRKIINAELTLSAWLVIFSRLLSLIYIVCVYIEKYGVSCQSIQWLTDLLVYQKISCLAGFLWLLSDSLWTRGIVLVRAPYIHQIDLFENYSYSIGLCVKNKKIWTCNESNSQTLGYKITWDVFDKLLKSNNQFLFEALIFLILKDIFKNFGLWGIIFCC